MIKKILTVCFTLIILLCCSCAHNPVEAPAATDNPTAEATLNPTEIPTAEPTNPPVYDYPILETYASDDTIHQMLVVIYKDGSDADVTLYVKNSGVWTSVLKTTGLVGKNGIDKTQEGDSKTPTGDFPITGAFGILENPGTTFSYINVTDTTYACDEDCEWYNQIIDTAATGHTCSGEKMSSYSPQYNYGLIVGYNSENVYPLGSAIFVHCKGSKGYTGGCVAVTESEMITILKYAEPGMRIYIGR